MAPRNRGKNTKRSIRLTRRSKKTVAPARLSAPVVKAVNRLIDGKAETKYQFGAKAVTSFNSSITSTSEWYNCLPDVPLSALSGTGTHSWERVGNKITPTSLKMSWAIGYNPNVTRSCDNYVVLYIFKHKTYKTYDSMKADGDPARFLNQGSAGLVTFGGYLQQLMTPVNTEDYILVHRKIIHLQKGVGNLNNNEPSSDNVYAGNGNTSAKMIHYTYKPPTLQYGDTGGFTQPTNFGMCWALGYAHADGAVPDNINQDIQVSHTSLLYFKDS